MDRDRKEKIPNNIFSRKKCLDFSLIPTDTAQTPPVLKPPSDFTGRDRSDQEWTGIERRRFLTIFFLEKKFGF